jgi:hypothetical protein
LTDEIQNSSNLLDGDRFMEGNLTEDKIIINDKVFTFGESAE